MMQRCNIMSVFKTIRAAYQNYLLIPTFKPLILLFLFKNDVMRNLIYTCLIGLIALSCDDGDIFEVELLFNQELELCIDVNTTEGSTLLYDTKVDPNESLSVQFPISGNTDIFSPTTYNNIDLATGFTKILTVDESSIKFNYRTYNGAPEGLICQINPEPGTTIINDYEAVSGAEIKFVSTFEDDDNDGIPSDQEGRGVQADDGSYPDAIDTDGDGLANYVDADDDNDNVLTINEISDPNDDGYFSDSLNTDLDLEIANGDDPKPNYLDNDDDGDMVLTREENEDEDNNLNDDVDENTPLGMAIPPVPRYLDFMADTIYINDVIITTTYERTVTVEVTVLEANIEIINISPLFLGTYINTTTLPEEEE
jgi:hypothetical protein